MGREEEKWDQEERRPPTQDMIANRGSLWLNVGSSGDSTGHTSEVSLSRDEGHEGLIPPVPISRQTFPKDRNSATLPCLRLQSAVQPAGAWPATETRTLAAGSKSLGSGQEI